MPYKCDICGQEMVSKTAATSTRHLTSKKHIEARNKQQTHGTLPFDLQKLPSKIDSKPVSTSLPDFSINESKFVELLLFQGVSLMNEPNFSNLLTFCSSFGSKTEIITEVFIRKIQQGDLMWSNLSHPQLTLLYHDLFKQNSLTYPLTIKIVDVARSLPSFHIQTPFEAVELFKKLEQEFPSLLALSSSRLGEIVDLVTFKRLFPNNILFTKGNRWAL